MDDRLKVAAPVCMVSAYMQGGCNCENAPGLRLDTCNVDFGAMMAPRPLLLISSTRDWTKHTARIEYPAIQRVYALFGATDKVAHVPFDAGHGYNRDMRNVVYPWLAKWLGLPLDAGFTEPKYETEANSDLLVFNEAVPANAAVAMKALPGQAMPRVRSTFMMHPFTSRRRANGIPGPCRVRLLRRDRIAGNGGPAVYHSTPWRYW